MNKKIRYKLRKIFNKYDPIGIYQDDETNVDEYDPEIERVITKFNKSKNENEFLTGMHAVFVDMFGDEIAGSKSKYKGLAKEVYKFLKQELSGIN